MIDIKLADLNLATGPFLALLKILAIANEDVSRGDTRPAKTAAATCNGCWSGGCSGPETGCGPAGQASTIPSGRRRAEAAPDTTTIPQNV